VSETRPTQETSQPKPKLNEPDAPLDTNLAATGDVEGATKSRALQVAEKNASAATLTAEQRLRALLGKGEIVDDKTPAPKPAVLEKAIVAKLGDAASYLSAPEIAAALGAPSFADAIAKAGLCDVENTSPKPNWLLAVHLTKWMESLEWAGATRADVAQSFFAAHPELKERFPHVDGAFIAALQKSYAFMPQWSTSPAPIKSSAGDWDSLDSVDPFKDKLDAALKQISEVPLAMKLTGAMADRLSETKPFANANVVMVQHMLGQAHPLVDAMERAGMDVSKAEYVGIPYARNPAVKTTLEQGHGLPVTVPEVGNIDDMWRVITEAVDRAWERHLKNGEPILIMDDGGYASKYIAQKYRGHGDVFHVVEQTTRGLTEISQIENIEHSVVDVAGSYGKRFESAQVGDAVKMAVRRVLDAMTTTPARKDVLVVGAGKVGESVADSFAGDGARITVFDPFITPARKKELEKKGYNVVTDKAQALDKKFLVVGCSGHRSIDMDDFAKMSSPVFLASASSKRVEVDVVGLAKDATDKEGHLRRILAAKVGEQETYHYFLEDGRIVTAINDTLPSNFGQAVNSIAPELIDHTMALMLLGAAQAMTSTKPGLNALDPDLQFWLQAQMEGLSTTSPGEIALKCGDMTFGGSRADWMRVATSPATPPAVLHRLFAQLVEKNPMDSIALAILSSKHDLSEDTLDLVLRMQVLPHVARLVQNEGVTEAQEARLLDWVEKVFWVAAGRDDISGGIDDVRKYNAVAVQGDEARGYGYLYADVIEQNGKMYLAHRVTNVRDAITQQASDILFGHAHAPQYLRDAFLARTYEIASDGLASTVLRVSSPAWSSEDLTKLFDDCASAAYSRVSGGSKRASAEYAYDLMEAFRDHPSTTPEIVASSRIARPSAASGLQARRAGRCRRSEFRCPTTAEPR
jgi:S-adenosylhomocysteine hydrolase